MLTATCGGGGSAEPKAQATETVTTTASPKALVSSVAPEPTPEGDEPAFLASVHRHLAGTVLEALPRSSLLELGRSSCDAFGRGTNPTDILSSKALPPRPARVLIVDAGTHLCPDYNIALPKLLTKPEPFPPGFPKVVPVSSLPEQPRYSLRARTRRQLRLRLGVWTPLAPGATVQDAVNSGTLDGFCGSIKAYERKYTGGEQHEGSCW